MCVSQSLGAVRVLSHGPSSTLAVLEQITPSRRGDPAVFAPSGAGIAQEPSAALRKGGEHDEDQREADRGSLTKRSARTTTSKTWPRLAGRAPQDGLNDVWRGAGHRLMVRKRPDHPHNAHLRASPCLARRRESYDEDGSLARSVSAAKSMRTEYSVGTGEAVGIGGQSFRADVECDLRNLPWRFAGCAHGSSSTPAGDRAQLISTQTIRVFYRAFLTPLSLAPEPTGRHGSGGWPWNRSNSAQ